MFTFLKRRRAELDARKKIGIALHRQIKDAFEQDEEETARRLMTFFTAGYVYGFVRIGFSTLISVSGERATDRHIRHICNGVLPGKLWENLNRKLAALEIARNMDDQHKKLRSSDLTPAEGIKLFEAGFELGFRDASYSETFQRSFAFNLRKFLVGELDDYRL